jgi:hypothetical protein
MAGSDLSISRVGFPTADIDVGILVKLAEDCCLVRHFSLFEKWLAELLAL